MTEMITNINIPSCMVMVGMGIPLHRIPDVRRLYGLDPNDTEPFDLDVEQADAVCHTLAVRVTAENPDEVLCASDVLRLAAPRAALYLPHVLPSLPSTDSVLYPPHHSRFEVSV